MDASPFDLISNPVAGGARVLVVDDQDPVCVFLQRLLEAHGYEVIVATDGRSALAAVAALPPDVILLDIGLPDLDGFHVCRRLKQESATRLTPVVFVTGRSERELRVQGLACGADDFLTKPVDSQELLARVRSLVRMKRYTDDLDSAASFILMLANMIETRDGQGQGHCHRMANYATALGRALELSNRDVQTLHRGGFLHDIGMLAISDSMLRKPGALAPEEFELVKSHTVLGDAWCSELRSLQAIRPIVRSHHERLDGSGYPDGLRGDEIPLLAQIVGVVDVYEALTANRPYQQPRSPEETAGILRMHVTNGWRSREIVETFVGLIQSGALAEVPTTLASDPPPLSSHPF